MIRRFVIAGLMLVVLPIAAQTSTKSRVPQFQILKSKNSFPLDCHFQLPALSGRMRISGLGEAHLLLKAGKTKHECTLKVFRVSVADAKLVPTSSLHFKKPLSCRPALPAATAKLITHDLELEMSYDEVKLFAQTLQNAGKCKILRFERGEMARVVKKFSRQTGTGEDAERSLQTTGGAAR